MPSLLEGPPPGRDYRSEEDAKIRWIVPLLEELGHDPNRDMSFEVPVHWQAGTTRQAGRADIIVFVGDIPVLIAETKAPGQSLNAAREQAITYAKSFSPIVPFVLAHDISRVVIYRASGEVGRQGEYVYVEELPTRADLLGLIGMTEERVVPVVDRTDAVSRVVASEHYRYILAEAIRIVLTGSGLDELKAVSELSKVLVAKTHHESRATGRFRPGANVREIFNEAKAAYPGLFRQGETIELDRRTFDDVARLLAQAHGA